MFSCEIFSILHLAERLSVTVVGHAAKRAIRNWFEISVSSEWGVMLVHFLVSVSLTPGFICVGRLGHSVLDSVLINHLIIN